MKWLPLLTVSTLAIAYAGCMATSEESSHRSASRPQDNHMTPEVLARQVEARQPESVATASRLGPSAGPVLARLAKHDNEEVRTQALICLRAAGGSDAAPTAIAALDDEEGSVVAAALQVLNAHPPASDAPLLQAYARHDEARDQIALAAGRLGERAAVTSWKAHWQSAPPGTSLGDALLTAVARMGDSEARKQFGARLRATRGYDTPPWIERAVYQESLWVIEHLVVLLDVIDTATELTPDDPTDLRPLRTCDLAANGILRLTGARVPFQAPRPKPYTPSEIEQFRQLAQNSGAPRR